MLDEMLYVRSWLYETHRWHKDITDFVPSRLNIKPKKKMGDHLENMQSYFERFRPVSDACDKDDKDAFHHMEFTTQMLSRHFGQINPYHGLNWRVVKSIPPRDIRVLRVDPNSPAAELELGIPIVKRGDKLLKFGDIDVVSTTDKDEIYNIEFLIHGHWKLNLNQEFTYEFEDRDSSDKKTRSIVAKRNEVVPVYKSRIIETKNDKVGYIALDTFKSYLTERKINKEFRKFVDEEVSDLILDLRNNEGGGVHYAAQIAYMIAGKENTEDKMFAKLELNYDPKSITSSRNDVPHAPIEFGKECQNYSYYDCGYDVGSSTSRRTYSTLDLNRVFVLTSEETCGASEALINGLRGAGVEVILIGDTTCGQIYGTLPESNCGLTYYGLQFQVKNDKGFGGFNDGFTPKNTPSDKGVKVKGCYVKDDLTKEVGEDDDVLLTTALAYRQKGENACPEFPTSFDQDTQSNSRNPIAVRPKPKRYFGYNMDITLPRDE